MPDVMVVEVCHPDWPGEPMPIEVREGEAGLEIRVWAHPDVEYVTQFHPLRLFSEYVQTQVRAGVSRGREGA